MTSRGRVLTSTTIGLGVVVVLLSSLSVLAEQLGDVTVTLQSHRYYRYWDMTRLVYRVKSKSKPKDASFLLGTGACLSSEAIEEYASTRFDWVDEPFRGLRFDLTKKNQKIYLWLLGQWELSETQIAILEDEDEDVSHTGEIDGPACAGASISIETLSGQSVSFPDLAGAGTYWATDTTELRVSSSSAGWALTYAIELSVPEGASETVVAQALQVAYDPFETIAGVIDLRARYALNVAEEDFAGLPEGAYVIHVTHVVSTD